MTGAALNRRLILKSRPKTLIEDENFALETAPVPEPGPGQVLIRNLLVSIDPGMRGWLRAHRTYTDPVALGDVMRAITLGQVAVSNHPDVAAGSFVVGWNGIQDYALSNGSGLDPVDPAVAPLDAWLGPLGMTGTTAYIGLFDIGRAKAGDVVLVSAASGAVGQIAGQLAKLSGCTAIGLAGSDEKCALVTGTFGFDHAINYKTAPDLPAAIREACKKLGAPGIDVYFDNVGGEILDAALACINERARIVICGMISQYNNPSPDAAYGVKNTVALLRNRARMEGFIVFDRKDLAPDAHRALGAWVRSGALAYRNDVTAGIENAPRAMRRMFLGENTGKSILKIADPS